MDDRLKFRVWDKENNRFLKFFTLEFCDDGSCNVNDDETGHCLDDDTFEIIQCTGLRDKNGELIFEGDIVRYEVNFGDDSKPNIEVLLSEVIFKKGFFVTLDIYNMPIGEMTESKYDDFKTEIIGNKFENPELIERG